MNLAVALVAALSLAAPPEVTRTIAFIDSLHDPATGAYRVKPGGPLSLRACNGATRSLRKLGADVPDVAKTRVFVRSCYDASTGTFREPDTEPNVASTAVGVLAAVELGVPRAELKPAIVYLGKSAKTFEEVRIAAAAVEAFGVVDCPFDLAAWDAIVLAELKAEFKPDAAVTDQARLAGSAAAYFLRLDRPLPEEPELKAPLFYGQMPDRGYGVAGTKVSDLESIYRVVRALHLLREHPAVPQWIPEFIGKCKNADGGYGLKPGEPSTMSGVYYAVMTLDWSKAW